VDRQPHLVSDDPPASPPLSPLRFILLCQLKLITIAAGTTGLAALIRMTVLQHPINLNWACYAGLAAIAALSGALLALRLYSHWHGPTRHLERLLSDAARGQLPIDDLATLTGGPAILTPHLQYLLRQLKETRAHLARAERELGHRVASSTRTLQHQLGTLRIQASRDPLTGLLNRRTLDEAFTGLLASAESFPLAVMAIDIDHFKHLNDTRGHAAGDAFLKQLAELMRSGVRDQDACFRTGGDEFVILLPNCSQTEAHRVSDRLTKLVDQLVRPWKLAKLPGLSIGIVLAAGNEDPTALLARADAEAYKTKSARKAGRAAA
jgi:diguanylate cyclase (GGDEF)-like protein